MILWEAELQWVQYSTRAWAPCNLAMVGSFYIAIFSAPIRVAILRAPEVLLNQTVRFHPRILKGSVQKDLKEVGDLGAAAIIHPYYTYSIMN